MPHRPSAAVLLLGVLAAPLRPQLTVSDIAERMQAAAGEAAATSAGDCEVTGQVTFQGQEFAQRIFLRRDPFSYREERTWIAPRPGAPPPPGVALQSVVLSDGEHAWNPGDAAPAAPLRGWSAIEVLDTALLFRLLLDPAPTLERGMYRPPRVVTEQVARPGVEEEVLFFVWPHGTGWLARIERASGRLTELFDSTGVTQRWYRLKDWRVLQGGSTLPALIEMGAGNRLGLVLRLHSLRHGLSHPTALFPEAPAPGLGAVADVSALRLLHGSVPGTALVILPEGGVRGGLGGVAGVWTLFDTGTSGLFIDARLARPLGLPRVGLLNNFGAVGGGMSDWLWVDRLDIGQHGWLQLPASTPPMPEFDTVPPENPVRLVFGGPRLLECSPILDLRAGRLLLRGRDSDGRILSLSEFAGRPALSIPLASDGRGSVLIDYSLGGASATAILDTGLSHALRLSLADMRRLGVPEDDAWWKERGAQAMSSGGIHGHEQVELMVRLEQDLHIGPVTLRQPYAILKSAAVEGAAMAIEPSVIGMGALTAFEQVGFDGERALELVAPEELLQPGEPLRAVVPRVDDHLGFELRSPDLGASSRPHNLPVVTRVVKGLQADRAGLRSGDRLAEVNGVACDGVAPMDLWERLRVRNGQALEVKVLREPGEVVVARFGD